MKEEIEKENIVRPFILILLSHKRGRRKNLLTFYYRLWLCFIILLFYFHKDFKTESFMRYINFYCFLFLNISCLQIVLKKTEHSICEEVKVFIAFLYNIVLYRKTHPNKLFHHKISTRRLWLIWRNNSKIGENEHQHGTRNGSNKSISNFSF